MFTHNIKMAAVIGSIILSCLLLNLPILQTIWRHSFDDGTYSHAYLVPLISLYLLYLSLSEGKIVWREKFSPLFLLATVVSALALFAATNAQISVGYWLALLVLMIFSLLLVFKLSYQLIFPVAYLIFLLPLWGTLTGILQTMSVSVASFVMKLTGIPVFVESIYVHIPSGTFEIADGCSGLRYFIVSMATCSVYLFMFVKSRKVAAGLIVFAVLGALVTNWIRIILLIVIGHFTEMQSSLMEDHNTFGWYLYVPFMLLFFFVANKSLGSEQTIAQEQSTVALGPGITQVTKLSLVLSLVLVVLSSSALTMQFSYVNHVEDAEVSQSPKLPVVSFADTVLERTWEKAGSNFKHVHYGFSGKVLDGKPSYYENVLVPKMYKVLDSTIVGDFKVLLVAHKFNRNKYKLAYQYSLGEQKVASLGALKLLRLKHGFSPGQKTSIDWYQMDCAGECKLDEALWWQ